MNDELQVIVQRMVEAGEPEENIKLVIENYKPTTSGGGESKPGKPLGSEEPTQNLEGGSPSPLQSQLEQKAEEAVETNQVPKGIGSGFASKARRDAEEAFFKERGVTREEYNDSYLANKYGRTSIDVDPTLEGKQYTTLAQMEDMGKGLSSINERINSVKQELSGLNSASRFRDERDKYKKFSEELDALQQQKTQLSRIIQDSKATNADIIASEQGFKYKLGDKEVLFSEFNDYLTKNAEAKDKLLEDPKFFGVEGADQYTKALTDAQKKAVKASEGKALGQQTAEDFLANAFDIATGIGLAETAAGMDGDYEENLLLLREGVEQAKKNIQGDRLVEPDAIDKIKQGEIAEGVGDLFSSFVGSAPYMLTTMIPYAGTPLLFKSLAANKYADLRNEGATPQDAILGALGSATLNSVAETVGARLLTKAIKPVQAMKGGGIPVTSQAVKSQVKKNLGNALLGEPTTEYLQEGGDYLIDQVSLGKEVDWSEFNRRGALGAGSALVGGGTFAGLGSGKNYYFATEQAAKNRAKAVQQLNGLIDTFNATEDADLKVSLRNQAEALVKDLDRQANEAKDVAAKTTPEEKKKIDEFQREIVDLQKIMDSDAPQTVKDNASDRMEQKKEEKDELINEIQERDAIQEQETRDIPDAEPAEGVQEMEEEVREPSIEEKKQEIEQRRQEELFNAPNEMLIAPMISDGKGGFIANPEIAKAKEVKEEINAKYDAELKALESTETEVREQDTTEEAQQEEVAPTQEQFNAALDIIEPLASQRDESITVEQAEQVFEALGENASDVIDVSTLRDKSAVELYNELSDKRDESAAKQVTETTTESTQEGETVQQEQAVVEQEGETTEAVDEGDRADTGGFKVINDAIKDIVSEPNDKSREKVAKAKAMMQERVDRAKADKDAKDFISRAIKDMIRQSGLTNVSRSTLNKLLAKVPKANRKNLRNIIEEAIDVIQNQVERKEASIRRSNRKKAINKVKSIGVLKELQEPLKNMLSINPDTLPKSARDAYDKVVRDLSMANRKYDRASREELLNLIQNVNTEYMKDLSRLDAVLNRLGDSWSADKTFKENMESVKDDLNESETEILNRYKSELDVKDSDSEVNTKKIKEQFEEAKSQIPKEMSGLTTEERAAHEKAKNIKTEEFDELSPQEQRKLVRGLEMLNDGFVGSNLLQGLSRVEAIRRANSIPKNLRQSGLLRKIYPNIRGAVKNFFKQDKESILKETIRSTPLKNLEQIFRTASKEFQKTNLYEALFRPTSVAFSKTESDMKDVNKVLSAAQDLLSTNPNERFKQKAKIMMYQLQKEFDSNPNNPEVNSAKDWVKATLEDPNSIYNDKEKAIIKEMMDGFIKDGEVDSKLIEESFTEKEKRAESLIRRAYDSLTEKAEADAAYRGIPFRTRKDYVHLPKTQKNSDQNIKDLDELREQFLQPSLKSKAAIERTGKTHAISLDPIANANASARKTITSYHMYPAVREAKMTFGYLIKNTEGKENKEIAEVLEEVYGEIVDSQYKASPASRSYTDRMLDKGMREIARLGYSAQLAGVVRAGWEFISNATHAVLVNPVEFVAGMDFLATHFKDGDMSTINEAIKNVGSTQSTRLAGEETLSSKDIETRLLDKKEFFNPERSGSEFKGKAKAAGSILGKFPRSVRAFNEFLMSQPDTSISKAIFIGNFNKTFKEKTGQSPNWNKLATDQAYREKYAEAIEEATSVADSAVIDSVASTNPFDGIPKNITDRQAGTIYRAYQMFDRYMTKFRTFEYYSTIKAIDSLMGRGELNEKDAAFLLAGTLLRMSMYKMGIDVTFGILFQALGIEDEEDDLEFKDEAIKSSIGAVITLAMGRNLGNVANLGINYGVEQINKELGEGITRNEEEYNRYKDSVVFNKIPMDDEFTETFMLDILTDMSGAYAPLLKTMKRAGVDIARLKKAKTEKTKNKYETELYQRIPFEILGNLGLIPAYKDLRKMMIQYNFQKSKEKNISDKDIINVFTKGMSSQEKKMFIEQLKYEDKRRAKDMKDRFKIK